LSLPSRGTTQVVSDWGAISIKGGPITRLFQWIYRITSGNIEQDKLKRCRPTATGRPR